MINIVKFDNSDVERSEIVKKVIEIYNYIKPINKSSDTIISSKTPSTSNYNVTKSTGIENKNENENENKKTKSNDAALIPKHHITHNYDIFFESRDF